VQHVTNVVGMAGGWYHSVVVDADGLVWAWGENFSGQLGDRTTLPHYTPSPVTTGAVGVTAGHHYSAAVSTDGYVTEWGKVGVGSATEPTLKLGVAGVATPS
jgi:alpha-tubulin suppressor-like RCC1 family protein